VDDAGFEQSPPIPPAPPEHQPLARFYLTSDLRAATGLTRTHLDYYLREGLIVPTARTESGYLLFDDAEVRRARQIVAARQRGESLKEIRAQLGRESPS
jgi:DNA-binding transcriptional MerR regulator